MQNKNSNSLFGADLNEYSSNPDFMTLSRTIDFLYLRSSGSGTGRFRVDRAFLEYARAAQDFGIPVGAYHFGVPSYDLTTADSQCDDFINILQEAFGRGDYGDLFPVLDVEVPVEKTISTEALINWIDRFRKRFERKTSRKLMLYTGAFFIKLYDNFYIPGRGYPLSNMPLWIAMYPEIPGNPQYPENQGGWTRWRIWQFSEKGQINGVNPPTDLNWGPDSIALLGPPSEVAGLSASMDKNNIYVNWSKNPEPDLAGYNIFVNDKYVATKGKNDTSAVIPKYRLGLSPNKPVIVSMHAFDNDGDISPRRTRVTINQNRQYDLESESIYISEDGIIYP